MSKFKKLERFSRISIGGGNQISLFYSETEMIHQGYCYRPKNFNKRIKYYERRKLIQPETIRYTISEFGIKLLKI